jgi:hypothetical protein
MRSRKPWAEKLRPAMAVETVPDPNGPGGLLLPTPMAVAGAIRKIRKGALLSVSELRERLAREHGAARTCPLMTGIFFNIVAGATEDDLAAGRKPLAPYWRLVRDDRTLSPKTPAGPARQAELLAREGHRVDRVGARWIVAAR